MAPRSSAVRPERGREALRPVERLRHLRVVNPADRTRPAFRLTPRAGLTLTVLLFAALFAVAVSHALLIESQIGLDRLDDQVAEEEARYERLRLDVAELQSPDRIINDAAAIGMVPPAGLTWVTPDHPAAGTTGTPGGPGTATGTDLTTADGEPTETSWEDIKPHLGTNP